VPLNNEFTPKKYLFTASILLLLFMKNCVYKLDVLDSRLNDGGDLWSLIRGRDSRS
jgi:hypothetical protein